MPSAIGDRPTPVKGDFASLLRAYRRRAGLTQDVLAGLSTVSARAIRDLEAGRARARAKTVELLADGLRLSGLSRTTFLLAARGWDNVEDNGPAANTAPPAPVTSIIGREAEVRSLVHALETGRRRAASLTGLAGAGKSRIALEAARQLHRRRRWPIVWLGADLPATGTSPLHCEVQALLKEEAGARSRLRRLIADHDVIIVLDGVDEVTSDWQDGLRLLLAECPGLRVVTTSRSATAPLGGTRTTVAPLPIPPDGKGAGPLTALTRYPSARLLIELVAEVCPSWNPTGDDLPAIETLCRRVDGVPLALQVIARHCATLSLCELAQLPMADLVGLTWRPSAGGPPVTIGETIGASCRMVPAADLDRLRLLVRRGRSWNVATAAAELGLGQAETLLMLDTLYSHGMIRRIGTDRPTRFEVLSLVSAYLGHHDQVT